eukprot:gene1088-2645_t
MSSGISIFGARSLIAALLAAVAPYVAANRTETWIKARARLIGEVYGSGDGILPTKSNPDHIQTWPEEPGLEGLVWNLTTRFPITSTVFYSKAYPAQRSKSAFLFHHGHSNCVCPPSPEEGATPLALAKCRPGCNSSMPSLAEIGDPGYSWWDLYNVSAFLHSLGHDVFILSMPLKGINLVHRHTHTRTHAHACAHAHTLTLQLYCSVCLLGPGCNSSYLESDHEWFRQWEEQGDYALRQTPALAARASLYFLEPAYLTVSYAKAQGYDDVYIAGLSGGGWSTTLAAAMDLRIKGSFPIAGSLPCAMRNPESWDHGQNWTGDSDEDFEQSCRPNFTDPHPDHTGPNCAGKGPCPDARPDRQAYTVCNYTCQYLLAGLEEGRYQVQILHEYDTCCFSPHARHGKLLQYESNIRTELAADGRASAGHGWFTAAADNHSKHEVCDQDKALIAASVAGSFPPGAAGWQRLPCDIVHQPLPAGCAQNRDPGLPPGYVPCTKFPNGGSQIPQCKDESDYLQNLADEKPQPAGSGTLARNFKPKKSG